jgi:hypothetical protein
LYSTYLWVIIVPALSFAYLCLTKPGGHRLVLKNRLDRFILAYIAYGMAMTGLGIAIGANPGERVQEFVHAYLPASIYFIARMYTRESDDRIRNVLNLAWVACLFIVLDGAIEYYVLEEMRMYKLIPWTALNTDEVLSTMASNVLAQNPMIPFHNISIFASEKVLSMAVSLFACFTAGFLLIRRPATGRRVPWFQKLGAANVAFFLALISLSVVLTSYAATATLFFTLFLQTLFVRTGRVRIIILFTLFFSGCLFVLQDYLISLYVYKFTAGAIADGRSAAQHTFSLKSVMDIYTASPLNLLLGGALLQPGSIRGGSGTELRLLVYPVHYGIGWAFIVFHIASSLIGYCRKLIAFRDGRDPVNAIGLAGLGIFIIYFTDVHYPSFDRHGLLEFFFVMAGLFASLHENVLAKESIPAPAPSVPVGVAA